MEPGDLILVATIVINVIMVAGLLLKELAKHDTYIPWMRWLLRAATLLLTVDMLLLTSYFTSSNFRYLYVWQYSSLDLSIFYKVSAVLAGQSGTLLFWVWVIFVSLWWMSEKQGWSTPLLRRTQLISLIIGLYLLLITFKISPFETIYITNPDLPRNFIPEDGSGLNALLITPWMAVHPPTLFIGYALMTIPFAAAMVYLLTGEKGWEPVARQWGRLTWLFLSWGIALGGLWAYLVLGWGGFWSWDPVETSSFIPWLVLTGFLHSAAQHRKNEKHFQLAAPLFAAYSFSMIVYAALVTRSGLFNSVHAFGESDTGIYLLALTAILAIVPTAIVIWKYQKNEKNDRNSGIDRAEMSMKEIFFDLFEKNNLFYITLILFGLLALISFWGITFPVIQQVLAGEKITMAPQTADFFNANSYPFVILMLLTAGFCLQYSKNNKLESIKILGVVVIATILLSFYKMNNFHVLDHTSPFFVSQPPLYRFLGEISAVSLFPPLGYLLYAVLQTFYDDFAKYRGKKRMLVKRSGVLLIHLGIVFILLGSPISVSFGGTSNLTLSQAQSGRQIDAGHGYSVMLSDIQTSSGEGSFPGTPIRTILSDPLSYSGSNVEVSGKVVDKYDTDRYSFITIDDGTGQMQIATALVDINKDEKIITSGLVMTDYAGQSKVYPLILFSGDVRYLTTSGNSDIQKVFLTVFKDGSKMGDGYAEYVTGKGGSATHPLVIRRLTSDIYILFQGFSETGTIPLTFKIIPMVNEVWLGVVFFSAGAVMIMLTNTAGHALRKGTKD